MKIRVSNWAGESWNALSKRADQKKKAKTEKKHPSARAKNVTEQPTTKRSARSKTTALKAEATDLEFRTTRNLLEIQEWAERREGQPAFVKGGTSEDEASLWIQFPGGSEAKDLEYLPWEDWYQRFLDMNLTFVYQDRTADGKQSQFYRLVPA